MPLTESVDDHDENDVVSGITDVPSYRLKLHHIIDVTLNLSYQSRNAC